MKNLTNLLASGAGTGILVAVIALIVFMLILLIATRVKIEDDPLYPKVTKLLSREPDTPRPIGELIDHEVYDNLPDAEKQRYILNLSSRFLAIKRKFCATPQPAAEK